VQVAETKLGLFSNDVGTHKSEVAGQMSLLTDFLCSLGTNEASTQRPRFEQQLAKVRGGCRGASSFRLQADVAAPVSGS
jgi:hypothetical protein